jgi:Zn-dependent protease with chaperone function
MAKSNGMAGLLKPLLGAYFLFLGGGALILLLLIGLLLATCWGSFLPAAVLAAIIVGLPAVQVIWAWSVVAASRRGRDEMELPLPSASKELVTAFVAGIARERECEPPDDIRVAPDTVAHVYCNDSGSHVLVIGGLAIQTFSQEALAGVIAHELGHIAAGDTRLLSQAAKRLATMRLLDEQLRSTAISRMNPFTWVTLLYHALLRRAFAADSRASEFAADRWIVKQVGKEQAAATLLRFEVPERLPYVKLLNVAKAAVETSTPLDQLFTEQARRIATIGPHEWKEAMHSALEREPDPYDSHPTLKQRLKAVKVSPKNALPLAMSMEGPPARDLFPDWPILERKMTEKLTTLLREAHLLKREAGQIIVGRPR